MPPISFSVFRDKILSGAKRHTIRAKRKYPIKVGDRLYLWWKQRSQTDREKLGEANCIRTEEVTIYTKFVSINNQSIIDPSELDTFAIADGFDNWLHMMQWFSDTHGLPFTGDLFEWDDIVRDPNPEFIASLNKYVSDNGLPESYYDQVDND